MEWISTIVGIFMTSDVEVPIRKHEEWEEVSDIDRENKEVWMWVVCFLVLIIRDDVSLHMNRALFQFLLLWIVKIEIWDNNNNKKKKNEIDFSSSTCSSFHYKLSFRVASLKSDEKESEWECCWMVRVVVFDWLMKKKSNKNVVCCSLLFPKWFLIEWEMRKNKKWII